MRTVVAIMMLAVGVGTTWGLPKDSHGHNVRSYYNYNGNQHHHHHHGPDEVDLYLKVRKLLVEAAANTVGFSPLALLNEFNEEVFDFHYKHPGQLNMYVREVENLKPHYTYHKEPEKHKPSYGRGAGSSAEDDEY